MKILNLVLLPNFAYSHSFQACLAEKLTSMPPVFERMPKIALELAIIGNSPTQIFITFFDSNKDYCQRVHFGRPSRIYPSKNIPIKKILLFSLSVTYSYLKHWKQWTSSDQISSPLLNILTLAKTIKETFHTRTMCCETLRGKVLRPNSCSSLTLMSCQVYTCGRDSTSSPTNSNTGLIFLKLFKVDC